MRFSGLTITARRGRTTAAPPYACNAAGRAAGNPPRARPSSCTTSDAGSTPAAPLHRLEPPMEGDLASRPPGRSGIGSA